MSSLSKVSASFWPISSNKSDRLYSLQYWSRSCLRSPDRIRNNSSLLSFLWTSHYLGVVGPDNSSWSLVNPPCFERFHLCLWKRCWVPAIRRGVQSSGRRFLCIMGCNWASQCKGECHSLIFWKEIQEREEEFSDIRVFAAGCEEKERVIILGWMGMFSKIRDRENAD